MPEKPTPSACCGRDARVPEGRAVHGGAMPSRRGQGRGRCPPHGGSGLRPGERPGQASGGAGNRARCVPRAARRPERAATSSQAVAPRWCSRKDPGPAGLPGGACAPATSPGPRAAPRGRGRCALLRRRDRESVREFVRPRCMRVRTAGEPFYSGRQTPTRWRNVRWRNIRQKFPPSPETSIESPQSGAQAVEKAVKSRLHDRARNVRPTVANHAGRAPTPAHRGRRLRETIRQLDGSIHISGNCRTSGRGPDPAPLPTNGMNRRMRRRSSRLP